MDFFEAQERARKRTHRLVVFFVLAVIGMIFAGYVAALVIFGFTENAELSVTENLLDWDPHIFLSVTVGTIAIVGVASLFKWAQMRQGGAVIAEAVGGRRVNPHTTDLRERKLLNVVEEMAIASGVPVPAVFVLDQEPGLNAFAAGLTTADAAVAVTRGTLEKLNRDELQGVIAHEFSHILNGDMRLNVRITAIVFGILVIGLIGRGILRSLGRGRVRTSGGGKNKGGGIAVIIAVGLALFIIGYLGYFFGRLIQAAVSRQREFLADASAVQFTRNPGGILNALRKIGGAALGSTIEHDKAGEFCHFFIAQAFKSNFGGLWATHPPLDERIRAIDPNWKGAFLAAETSVDDSLEKTPPAISSLNSQSAPRERKPIDFRPAKIVADIGSVTEAHFQNAQNILATIPNAIRNATREADTAQVLVYGLLMSADAATREKQFSLLAGKHIPAASTLLPALLPEIEKIDVSARLPLFQLSLPALRTLKGEALNRFSGTLDALMNADGKVTPFEYALRKMLIQQLGFAQNPARFAQFDSFSAVRSDISVILSALAHLSPKNTTAAFAEGASQLLVIRDELVLLEPAECGLQKIDAALDRIAVASLPIKKRLLVAAGQVISCDGTVTPEEAELFRSITAAIDVPMPTLAPNFGANLN